MKQDFGIVGRPAPELRVPVWLSGVESGGLQIAEIEQPVIYVFGFQSWCPGCHSHGFPALQETKEKLRAKGLDGQVKFIVVQTVFEGHDINTAEAARESVARYGLTDIALGHDSGSWPTLMADYRTGGTPWTVIIGPRPARIVAADGFSVDPDTAVVTIERLPAASPGTAPDATAGTGPA